MTFTEWGSNSFDFQEEEETSLSGFYLALKYSLPLFGEGVHCLAPFITAIVNGGLRWCFGILWTGEQNLDQGDTSSVHSLARIKDRSVITMNLMWFSRKLEAVAIIHCFLGSFLSWRLWLPSHEYVTYVEWELNDHFGWDSLCNITQ